MPHSNLPEPRRPDSESKPSSRPKLYITIPKPVSPRRKSVLNITAASSQSSKLEVAVGKDQKKSGGSSSTLSSVGAPPKGYPADIKSADMFAQLFDGPLTPLGEDESDV
ncbi:hypothetical protein EVG20_g10573 [Dentipellis fragilis]|uniref:Uncharacterized protein n=1 Tax=Dentipellis fragilis TaxID=205917 RepID=A0A4Y9XQ01_9AGAM|nr:hypothetical protein EVG20_g10573 [Dentipellis fragilis]